MFSLHLVVLRYKELLRLQSLPAYPSVPQRKLCCKEEWWHKVMTSKRSRDIDGGWAWVVLVAAFINLLIGPGLAFVGGIFQTVFLEHFHASVALTSWVTALFASLLQLAGPASSIISSHFSCRVSVMVGGVLLAVGLFVSSFVNTIHLLLVFMGIVAGIGLGLTYSASIVVVNLYFVKMRIFVTGLALSATGAGCLIFPLLCRHLLEVLSWRETLSLFAGLSLQMVVCGALMFPLHEQRHRTRRCMCFKQRRNLTSDSESDVKYKYDVPDNSRPELTEMLDKDIDEDINYKDLSIDYLRDSTIDCNISENTNVMLERNDVTSNYQNVTSREKSLFKNISFLVLCCHMFLVNAVVGIFLIHFPSFALTFPVTPAEVAFAMAMNGPSLTISRIILGALGNDDRIDPLSVYVGVVMTGGVVILVTPAFATTASTQVATMALLGLYLGGSYSFLTAITIDCVGLEQLAAAFGWEMICAGSGYLVAPPIAGWVVDTTGSYGNSIYLAGGLLYLSVLVVLLVPVLRGRPVTHPLHHPGNDTIIVDDQNTDDSVHTSDNDT